MICDCRIKFKYQKIVKILCFGRGSFLLVGICRSIFVDIRKKLVYYNFIRSIIKKGNNCGKAELSRNQKDKDDENDLPELRKGIQ